MARSGKKQNGQRPVDQIREFVPAAAGWRTVFLRDDLLPFCHSDDCPRGVHTSVEEIEAVFAARDLGSMLDICGIAAWAVKRTEQGQQLLPCVAEHQSALSSSAVRPIHSDWLAILGPGDLLPDWIEGAALLHATFGLCLAHGPSEAWLETLSERWHLDDVLDW